MKIRTKRSQISVSPVSLIFNLAQRVDGFGTLLKNLILSVRKGIRKSRVVVRKKEGTKKKKHRGKKERKHNL